MPWYEYSPGADGRLLPLEQIVLVRGDRIARVVGLIDSGADTSLIEASYADNLGLDRSHSHAVTNYGADGTGFTTFLWPDTPLEIEFQGQRIPFHGSFIDFPAGSDRMNLLGRNDFFQRFIIQFWDAAGLMNIDLSPDFSLSPLA